MASLTLQADAIRSALASIQTCTPTISASLKDLLQGSDSETNDPKAAAPKSRTTKPSQPAKSRAAGAAKKPARTTTQTAPPKAQPQDDDGWRDAGLPSKERAILATQVVNATLKTLGEAAKNPSTVLSPALAQPIKGHTRKSLRRSGSVPMTPLQPRSLNRVSTSPTKASRSPPATTVSSGCLAMVECARVAFSTLRALSAAGKISLPELQIESGMSSFINKLVTLGLYEHATKELRMLKRRLENAASKAGKEKTKATPASDSPSATKTLSNLFDYPAISGSSALIGLVITTQLQALRILYGLNKSAQLEGALPFLRASRQSSPLSLLLLAAGDEQADRSKCARQLDSLAQSLLSLTPNVAASEDGVAVEPRLSPSPETALEIQAIALAARLHSWRLSGHRGDIDKELLVPLSRCLAAFNRRSFLEVKSKSTATNLAFNQIWQQMEAMGLKPVETSKSPLTAIYQVLGAVCREAGNLKEAKNWIARLRTLTTPEGNSAARCCSVSAQLLAVTLKQSPKVEQTLIQDVLDGLQGSLSGNTTELDELLVNICQLRKIAATVVLGDDRSEEQPSPSRESLESLLLQLPRFVLRWLGKPPAAEGATKEFLRFGQRRQLLSKYIHQVLDSALILIKVLLEESKMPWDLTDSVLQDSLLVLEYMGDSALNSQKDSPAASYYVKISHFYYQQHIALRKAGTGSPNKDSLRALRRSIDAVKTRPEAEQSKSQLILKQERLAELCRTSGRKDDAVDALRSIRDTLVREDAVPGVTQALSRLPLLKAWQVGNNAQSLSRTVCNLAKLEPKPCDWTWLLTGPDKATAMEHDLYFIYSRETKHHQYLAPGEPLVDNLLQAFSAKDFPLRRLRTLLQLLIINLDSPEQVRNWVEEVKSLREGLDKSQLGEDSGLSGYFEHLSSLAVCVVGLLDFDLCSPQIREAIGLWTSRVTDCKSEDDLCICIDNPEQLLKVLQSLSDFARMKGMDSVLGSILELSARLSRLAVDDNPEMLVVQHTALSLQHLAIGHSAKAEAALKNGHEYLMRQEMSSGAQTSFHLCSAEYHMAVGNFDRAASHLADAHASGTAFLSDRSSRISKLSKKMAIAHAAFLQSILALERGNSKDALVSAKDAVRILYHDWAKLEALRGSSQESGDEPSQNETSDDPGLGNKRSSSPDVPRTKTGPEFWAMAYPLFRFLLRLSSIYAHIGMYQETIYYAEQAEKVARSTEAPSYILQSQVWLATVFMTAGQAEKARDLASSVKESISSVEATGTAVSMACQLSRIFRSGTDEATESTLLGMAESMIETINKGNVTTSPTTPQPEKEMEKPAVKPSAARKTTAAPRQTRAKTPAATSKVAAKRQAPPAAAKPVKVEDRQLSIWRASILQQRSESLLEQREWTEAIAALQEACELSKLSADITRDRLYTAMALIGQSLDQMGRDSVFSVIQDSTLSFPAVASALKEKSTSDKASPRKAAATPARKARAAPQDAPKFIETLRKAHECLVEAHSIAILNGDGGLVQRVAALLQNVFILMSTTAPARVSGIGHPAHATCSVELARNLTWRRERKTLKLDSTKTMAEWPMPIESSESRRTSLAVTVDVDRFQKEFVDIIPSSWNVVSVSLSDTKHDLCITKLQAGHSPFAIRLPLERASSRDADNEVFNFEQGRAELLDIIQIANQTCHDARDMSAKGAKSAWWAQREALDKRMKDLMENIEQTWLGGFRGIFAQHHRRSDLLTRFYKSFQDVLDSNLPSRRQVRGKRTKAAPATRVSLDPRILDLFIGLGDVTIPECDLDEPLTDLLYFVVDILQFHGERNAYDEIDFDRMVVGTMDALHSYHAAAKSSRDADEGTHTILVLDKSLHVFPWESLPCMQALAVSRVPSLACLRRSIVEARSSHEESQGNNESTEQPSATREGHHIPNSSGAYILNPSADLKSTQATFGKPLATLPLSWSAIEARAPTEAEFEKALTESDLLLYFGHGSGAQYIRGRTIRKLDKCRAVALLMGCSSASLTTPGDFEPHGPVWNYMLAGSPAVVGTLWDVTDRDIDRYAGRLFEEWGLFPRGTFVDEGKGSKGGKKTKVNVDADADHGSKKQNTSLVEAVAKARDACRFRYLTAAAVCVYGIPVYVGK